MDIRNRNLYPKRTFGRDLTNLNVEKRTKNYSISQKPTCTQEAQSRLKSKSISFKPILQYKDQILQYEKQIVDHMIGLQKMEQGQIFKYVTQDMRFVLIDWLIEVHESFELCDQTLHLALKYLNMFSSKYEISKQEYQLVGITCLWIASKYEQIYPPKMHNYVDVTDNSYTLQELKDMEGRIIEALNFNLTYTTSLNLLQAIADKWQKQRNFNKELVLTKQSLKHLNMTKFLLEMCEIDNMFKQYSNTTIVMTAISLTDTLFNVKSEIRILDEEQKPNKETLLKCFRKMCNTFTECQYMKRFNALVKKYQKEKYSKVARLKITKK